jgi:hypothetical protein
MNDGDNKNPIPRVVKGTGFYTPMDLAPVETPAEVSIPSPVREMTGLPTSMQVEPPADTQPAPSQDGDDSGNAKDD